MGVKITKYDKGPDGKIRRAPAAPKNTGKENPPDGKTGAEKNSPPVTPAGKGA